MLKYVVDDDAARKDVPTAKPRRKPINIQAGYENAMQRHSKIIARLAQ